MERYSANTAKCTYGRPALLRKVLLHAGDLGYKAFDTQPGRVGTLVCWDQWYPRARAYRVAGSECAVLSHGHRLAPCGEG